MTEQAVDIGIATLFLIVGAIILTNLEALTHLDQSSGLRTIHGETTMGWTASVTEMKDGSMFSYGTRFVSSFLTYLLVIHTRTFNKSTVGWFTRKHEVWKRFLQTRTTKRLIITHTPIV